MPRGPRLDAPGALHHVMVRGLDRQTIFRTEEDRRDFVDRLARVSEKTGLAILGWALLPNHFHLLARTGRLPLTTAMRRLLTGYAVNFNRRHRRAGHLFQNRYKSILVEEDPYLLELVRYIHLNPLRAGVVRDLPALDRYPWTGHTALMGQVLRPWQVVEEVLRQYGERLHVARQAYRAFVAEGVSQGRRPELQGGGLRRSAGGWESVVALRRGRERWAADERILGGSDFAERMLREAPRAQRRGVQAPIAGALPRLIERVAQAYAMTPDEIVGGSKRRAVVAARSVVSALALRELGLPLVRVARTMNVSSQTVLAGIEKGAAAVQSQRLNTRALLAGLTNPKKPNNVP
jgi:putative transposase